MVATAIIGGAVVSTVGSIVASDTQADAAESAADTQLAGQLAAVAESRRQYDITREDFAPYRETGENALVELAALYGMGREGVLPPEQVDAAYDRFRETPGYEFRLEEGARARDRSAASRGRLRSGGFQRELERYGQGVASTEFNTYADRLAALAGVGQSSTSSTAAAGSTAASQIGSAYTSGAAGQANALIAGGTARASGYAGVANAANSGIQNYMLYSQLQGAGFGGAAGYSSPGGYPGGQFGSYGL